MSKTGRQTTDPPSSISNIEPVTLMIDRSSGSAPMIKSRRRSSNNVSFDSRGKLSNDILFPLQSRISPVPKIKQNQQESKQQGGSDGGRRASSSMARTSSSDNSVLASLRVSTNTPSSVKSIGSRGSIPLIQSRRRSTTDVTSRNFDVGDELSNDILFPSQSRFSPVPKTNEQQRQQQLKVGSDGGRRRASITTAGTSPPASSRRVSGPQATYAIPTSKEEGIQAVAWVPMRSSRPPSSGRSISNNWPEAVAPATSTNNGSKNVGSNLDKISYSDAGIKRDVSQRSSRTSAISGVDDDNWMEEALLHGTSTTNLKERYQPAATLAMHAVMDSKNGNTDPTNAASSAEAAMDAEPYRIKNGSSLVRRFSVPTKPVLIEDAMRNRIVNGDKRMSERTRDDSSTQPSSDHPTLNYPPRQSIDPTTSLLLLPHLPSALLATSLNNKNMPLLPTIKTYRLMKQRPDEQAGLFLTKAKNGAVLVHSLAPESPFKRISISPGQEILSVNQKRINCPKLAARIITHAKKHLILRVSTVQRGRGFMYCQVKRRDSGVGEAIGDGVVVDESTGTNSEFAGGAIATKQLTPHIAWATTDQKRGSVVSSSPFYHGLRFVTTSVDGLRQGTVGEGLVRVSHIDADGLFGSSQNMNLRVGGIVLTVNGIPVTTWRAALDKIMGSRCLIEILHCDERVWRDAWVKDGLKQVMLASSSSPLKVGGEETIIRSSNNPGDDDAMPHSNTNSSLPWDLEWQAEYEEVVIRKGRTEVSHGDVSDTPTYTFKLVFHNDVGRCYSELVDGITEMPPTDELDVSLLVQIVNQTQMTMMTVIMNMLRKANFELSGDNGSFPKINLHLSSLQVCDETQRNNFDKKGRSRSTDLLMETIKDEHGGVDKERSQHANCQWKVGSRDRSDNSERLTLQEARGRAKTTLPQRRGSAGFMQATAALSSPYTEQWRVERWENQSNDKKLRDFSARQHEMDDNCPAEPSDSRLSTISGFSMFSDNGREHFAKDLEDEYVVDDEDATFRSSLPKTGETPYTPNSPSKRNGAYKWDDNTIQLSHAQETSVNYQCSDKSFTEKNEHIDVAFITGVFRDVASKYEISDTIVGSGGFGDVRECYDKKTRKIYVVKSILKPEKNDGTKINLIRNEILLLHEANHDNIVDLRDLFEDDKYVHIVMERCTGGDLFDRVVSENPRQINSHAEAVKYETRMAHAMRSILNVLKYLNSKHIVHRDIKPEHFLLTTDDRDTQKIKLIDFGLARKHKPNTAPMKTFTGSPSFVAPEVIARRYDRMCDMFSVGVTAYFLLTGMLPFDGRTDEETFDLISIGKFKFPSSLFLSNEAKDFITNLLKVDPKKRMSADEALNHPWLLNGTASC